MPTRDTKNRLGALDHPARHEIEQRGARGFVLVVDFVKKVGVGHEPFIAGTDAVDERPRSADRAHLVRSPWTASKGSVILGAFVRHVRQACAKP